jgi:hypothetical protein
MNDRSAARSAALGRFPRSGGVVDGRSAALGRFPEAAA